MIGHSVEFDALRQLIDQVPSGRAQCVCLLVGPGKDQLFRKAARGCIVAVLHPSITFLKSAIGRNQCGHVAGFRTLRA